MISVHVAPRGRGVMGVKARSFLFAKEESVDECQLAPYKYEQRATPPCAHAKLYIIELSTPTTVTMSDPTNVTFTMDNAEPSSEAHASPSPRHHVMAQHCRISCDRADRYSQTAYKQWVNGMLLTSVYNLGKYRSPFSMVTAWGIPILFAADMAVQCVPVWQGYREIRMLPRAESDFNQRGYRFRHFALARMFSVSSESGEEQVGQAGPDPAGGSAPCEVLNAAATATATTWRRWGTRWGKLDEQA
ncbi:hypothetical protein BCR44DRAFT_1428354 [Catenaria anguillulae PL171]|uniref:Uncharacterized protein n=1 Tax=Catenaria anguillulae PL171 TaxID=765915 RepID=A0A1Y2HV46_9FUNG|nr:hypothetical protein BCR44DRAFT_1428354 [Catenaria anguillulae PL171]